MTPEEALAVRRSALTTHANSVDDVAGRADNCRTAAASVLVDRFAYGQLCQIIPVLLASPQNSTVDAIQAQVDEFQVTGDDLRTAARGYGASDAEIAALFTGSHG